MRFAISLIGCVALLGACSSEPDFDERYDTAQSEIEETAQSIENDLDAKGEEQTGSELSGQPTDVEP